MFTAAFTVTSSVLGNLIITDTSNYGGAEPKSGFITRLLYITYANGLPFSFLNSPDFSYTNYPTDALTVTMLRDFSLRVTMTVTSATPQPGSIYTVTEVVTLTNFSYLFLYSLSQAIAANPALMNITQFYQNLSKAYTLKNVANTAGFYSDQVSAQQALDSLNEMIQNQTNYFS